MSDDQVSHQEIIIVRRSRDDHDDHHGGAWKVAFADFMTAMMAFFLVMWLINASNEETKKAVASYFNPIKLTDRISNPKGLHTPKYGKIEESKNEIQEYTTIISNTKLNTAKSQGVAQTFDEQALFADPYALLAEISGGVNSEIDDNDTQSREQEKLSTELAQLGNEEIEDPFTPSAWNMNYNPKKQDVTEKIETDEENITAGIQDKHTEYAKEKKDIEPVDVDDSTSEKGTEKEKLVSLQEKILQIVEIENSKAPDVQITIDEKGLTLTLSDKSKIGMFNIGSARPSPELVRIMGKIGKLLSSQKGQIVVSGHTDGRKYKSKNYDNWRLSTARAHMAYYMLVNGGTLDNRFEKIQGYGDVKLAYPEDPLSPANRRIEVLLQAL